MYTIFWYTVNRQRQESSGGDFMLKLADYRSKTKGLPDLLPYAALAAPGIILNKEDKFLAMRLNS
jgi:hypothetical protein